jgi:tetratricopeptide (TPR) repeat protein
MRNSILKPIVFFSIIFLSTSLFAQKKKQQPIQPIQPAVEVKQENTDSLDWVVYDLAIKNGDFNTAIKAVYYAIARNPENFSYQDSLASLYYVSENYIPAIIVGRKILEQKPDDLKMLEIVASSEIEIGRLKEALEIYEKLQILTGSLSSRYQVAMLQYRLQRYAEGLNSLKALIAIPGAAEEAIRVPAGQQGQVQAVPLKAAALNLQGIIQIEMKEDAAAKESFTKALEVFPQFVMAQNNLQQVNRPKK